MRAATPRARYVGSGQAALQQLCPGCPSLHCTLLLATQPCMGSRWICFCTPLVHPTGCPACHNCARFTTLPQVCEQQPGQVQQILTNGVFEGLVAAAQPCMSAAATNCPDAKSRAALNQLGYLLGRMTFDEYERATPLRGNTWFASTWARLGANPAHFHYVDQARRACAAGF